MIRTVEKEIRNLEASECELRVAPKGREIDGLAIVFNKESRDLGGFREVIRPEAMDGIIERADVLALLNHSLERGILARSTNGEGTLKLSVTPSGVKYSFTAPHTHLGDEVVEGIRRKDIRTSSFAFTIAPGGEKWHKRDNDYLREITKFDDIYDVSPVYREAYQDTTVALRSIAEFKAETDSIIPEETAPIEVKPVIAETIAEPIAEQVEEFRMDDQSMYLEQKSINLIM
jgi:HK97 family phage prohead protease